MKDTAVYLSLFAIAFLVVIFGSGCLAHPGSTVILNFGWRSVQPTNCTNIVTSIDGGGSLEIPLK